MITPAIAILLVVFGACLGAGVVSLCVAAADGDKHADVARFLEGLQFSSENQGRHVMLRTHDFNRLARLAAANAPALHVGSTKFSTKTPFAVQPDAEGRDSARASSKRTRVVDV